MVAYFYHFCITQFVGRTRDSHVFLLSLRNRKTQLIILLTSIRFFSLHHLSSRHFRKYKTTENLLTFYVKNELIFHR